MTLENGVYLFLAVIALFFIIGAYQAIKQNQDKW